MNDELQQLLDNLDELTVEQLDDLIKRLQAEVDSRDAAPVTAALVNDLTQLADAAKKVQAARDKVVGFVAGGRPTPRPLTSFRPPAENPVTARPHQTAPASLAITASGREVQGARGIADEFAATLPGSRTGTGRTPVVQLRSTLPAARTLTKDPNANLAVIDAVVGRDALVASGGICKPVPAIYDVPGFSVATRPVRDALPGFAATRGGVSLPTPRDIADLAAGTSLWTAANDVNPGGANTGVNGTGTGPTSKPSLVLGCYTYTEVDVNAVTRSVTFGNMRARFSPEGLEADLDLLMAAHARLAEQTLLSTIAAKSTAVTWAAVISATRDLLVCVDRAAVAYRNRRRMAGDIMLQVILPEWVQGMIRSDLAKAAFPFEGDGGNSLGVTDAEIDALFTARHVSPVWSPDLQVLGAQTTGALLGWPSTVVMYLFVPGTFLFLDGGTLDLGLVRDTALNATNDAQMFAETFENVAKAGLESLQITATVSPTGAASGTVSPV